MYQRTGARVENDFLISCYRLSENEDVSRKCRKLIRAYINYFQKSVNAPLHLKLNTYYNITGMIRVKTRSILNRFL